MEKEDLFKFVWDFDYRSLPIEVLDNYSILTEPPILTSECVLSFYIYYSLLCSLV